MKVSEERIGDRQVVLNVEVEKERVAAALRRASKRISRSVQIPGFRKGKAPYRIVVQNFGEAAIYEEALDELGPEVYREALADRDIEPFDRASLDVIQFKPLLLEITVPLEPIVELGDYHQIRLTPEEVSVDEEQINALLVRIQEENAEEIPIERPAQFGDHLILHIEAQVNGKPAIDEIEEFVLTAEASKPVPGFSERLVGMMAGQEKEFSLTLPADYPNEDLAGKETSFRVLLHEVKETRLPEIDDDLARTVGDFETLDELEERLRESLQAEAKSEAQKHFAEKVLATLIAQAKIAFPPVLLERELDRMVEERVARLRKLGFTLEGYLKMMDKSEEEWREELRPQAEKQLKRSLVLGKVAELEEIEVEAAEVEEEINRRVHLLGDTADAAGETLSSAPSRRNIALELYGEKALQRLIEIATEAPEPGPKV